MCLWDKVTDIQEEVQKIKKKKNLEIDITSNKKIFFFCNCEMVCGVFKKLCAHVLHVTLFHFFVLFQNEDVTTQHNNLVVVVDDFPKQPSLR